MAVKSRETYWISEMWAWNMGTWIESAGKREGELICMIWPQNRSWLDDHFKIQELTLGSIAEIRIPSELAYGKKGIPRFLAPSISSFALVIVKDCFGLISQYITKDDLEISSEFRYRACRLWIDLWSSHLGSGWHSMRQRALREIGTCGIFCQRRRCLSSMVVGPSGVTRVDVWDFQLCFHVFMMFQVFWWSTDLSLDVFETWFPKGPRLLVPFEPNISDEVKLLQLLTHQIPAKAVSSTALLLELLHSNCKGPDASAMDVCYCCLWWMSRLTSCSEPFVFLLLHSVNVRECCIISA